jgi:DNA-binding NarL/FixJ family response regulator
MLLVVATGFDNDCISARLDMPMTTLVETMARAMDKLGAKDRHAAALKALRRGDILLDELHAFESE